MPEALRYAEQDNTIYIQAEGHLTAAYCADLRELIFKRLDLSPPVSAIKVDLSAVTYMDSTFMGLLVGFTKRLARTGNRLTIVRPSETASDLLGSLGILSLITVEESSQAFPTSMENLIRTQTSSADLLLRAHENLMELSDENRRKFSTLHQVLKQQSDSSKPGHED